MNRVRIAYRKYDGSLHWNLDGIRLGEDEHGVWVGVPAGTDAYLGTRLSHQVPAHVTLFPHGDRWWTAIFDVNPDRVEVYCDITTPHVWTGDEVSMVDLDLDVVRAKGVTELVDEDEFAEHLVRYSYPADVIANARASAEWLVTAVAGRTEPFGTAAERWKRDLPGGWADSTR